MCCICVRVGKEKADWDLDAICRVAERKIPVWTCVVETADCFVNVEPLGRVADFLASAAACEGESVNT
jgi:hypothetical protein